MSELAATEQLQMYALNMERQSRLMVGNAPHLARKVASELYELVGIPAARMDECGCGRYRFQHAPDESVSPAFTPDDHPRFGRSA